jgi:SAM-dependent methyltransferase
MGDRDSMGRSDQVDTEQLVWANRLQWDERVGIHVASRFYDVEGWLRDRPGPPERELNVLGDVDGLDLVHLQCHFGLDTLAWADAGARVTGVDFSPEAVRTARELASRAGLEGQARFVCADVFHAGDALDHVTFDIVSVSLGALCWIPSVESRAEQAAALVRPGGRLYLHDGHPVAWALADESHQMEHGYFEEVGPFVDDSDLTYTDSDRPRRRTRSYEWNHGIGEVVTALIGVPGQVSLVRRRRSGGSSTRHRTPCGVRRTGILPGRQTGSARWRPPGIVRVSPRERWSA